MPLGKSVGWRVIVLILEIVEQRTGVARAALPSTRRAACGSAGAGCGALRNVEWSFDAAEQDAQFFLGGSAVEYLHIDTERSEIPVFDSLAVGFAKYQNTGTFVVHIDEAAFDAERIGCNN